MADISVFNTNLKIDSHSETLNQSRGNTDGKLDSPPMVTGKRNTDAVGEELSTGDGERLDGDQCTSESSWSQLGDIKRGNTGSSTHTETQNCSTDDDLWDRERSADENRTEDKPHVTDGQSPFSTNLVGKTTRRDGTELVSNDRYREISLPTRTEHRRKSHLRSTLFLDH